MYRKTWGRKKTTKRSFGYWSDVENSLLHYTVNLKANKELPKGILEIIMIHASLKRSIHYRTGGSESVTAFCGTSHFLAKYIASTEESILVRRQIFFYYAHELILCLILLGTPKLSQSCHS